MVENINTIRNWKLLLTLGLLLSGLASADLQSCVVCSVQQSRLHTEECTLSSEHQDKTYFFCRADCQEKFLKAPDKWSKQFAGLGLTPKGLTKGDLLPDFRLPLDPAGSISSADVEGKVLVLNLWANWCQPCLEEMPDLMKLQAELEGDDVLVLALSFDKSKKEHRAGVKKLGLNFPSVYADQPEVQAFLKKLGPIKSIPATFVVDKDGKIVEFIDGPASLKKFRSVVKPLLKPSKHAKTETSGAVVPS